MTCTCSGFPQPDIDRDCPTHGEGALTLTEFLLARIAEDDLAIRENDMSAAAHAVGCGYDQLEYLSECKCQVPARVLAECEAKRRIVEYAETCDDIVRIKGGELAAGMAITARHGLRALALPYADHPDYDESWRP